MLWLAGRLWRTIQALREGGRHYGVHFSMRSAPLESAGFAPPSISMWGLRHRGGNPCSLHCAVLHAFPGYGISRLH